MAENLVKRQHYVPRTYLKHFATAHGDSYRIQALAIEKPEVDKIFEINTKNVALERNLYTLPGETAEEKMLIEKFYADEIEQHYDSIYAILKDPAKVELTPEERELIISTVVTMFYRTTKWISQHNELLQRVYSRMFELCAYTGKDSFLVEGERVNIAGRTLEDFLRERKIENRPGQVMTQLKVALRLIQIRLKSDNIYISTLVDNGCEFITSDNPVVTQSTTGSSTMPFDPTNIMKLPLDKKTMLFLMPDAEEQKRHRIIRNNVSGNFCKSEQLISNAEQFSEAERFILGDLGSLQSYLHTKDFAEGPMSPEDAVKIKSIDDFVNRGRELGLY